MPGHINIPNAGVSHVAFAKGVARALVAAERASSAIQPSRPAVQAASPVRASGAVG